MSVKTRELLLPISKRRKGKKLTSVAGVTIHNTGNTSRGADADANARYQKNSANESSTGWHWTVDEDEAILSIPEDEIVEHTGKRKGNDTTVGIEICDNSDGDALKATDNGAWLAAQVLKRQGYKKAVWKQNIFQHNDWSGKDCPYEIRRSIPYDWNTFLNKVNAYMTGVEAPSTPVETSKPVEATTTPTMSSNGSTGLPDGVVYYRVKTKERAYFRSAPDTRNTIMDTLDANTNLKYRGESGNYYYVTIDGTTRKGYVAKKLVVNNYLAKTQEIKNLQSLLGVTADGIYGKATADAVRAFQTLKGLTADSIYGRNTKNALENK